MSASKPDSAGSPAHRQGDLDSRLHIYAVRNFPFKFGRAYTVTQPKPHTIGAFTGKTRFAIYLENVKNQNPLP